MKPRFTFGVSALLGISVQMSLAGQYDAACASGGILYTAPPAESADADDALVHATVAPDGVVSAMPEHLTLQCGLPVEFRWLGEEELLRHGWLISLQGAELVSLVAPRKSCLVYPEGGYYSAPDVEDVEEAELGDELVDDGFAVAARRSARTPHAPAYVLVNNAISQFLTYENVYARNAKGAVQTAAPAPGRAASTFHSGAFLYSLPLGLTISYPDAGVGSHARTGSSVFVHQTVHVPYPVYVNLPGGKPGAGAGKPDDKDKHKGEKEDEDSGPTDADALADQPESVATLALLPQEPLMQEAAEPLDTPDGLTATTINTPTSPEEEEGQGAQDPVAAAAMPAAVATQALLPQEAAGPLDTDPLQTAVAQAKAIALDAAPAPRVGSADNMLVSTAIPLAVENYAAAAPVPVLSTGIVSSDSHITQTTQLPSSASTLYIEAVLNVTPTNTPGWTADTPLFGETVTIIRKTSGTAPSLIIDGEDQKLCALLQGSSATNTQIQQMEDFTVQNLHDRTGAIKNGEYFGITCGPSVKSTSVQIYIANNQHFTLKDNTREIAQGVGSTYSAGVVNVSGSVRFEKNVYIDIIGNKFIDNQGNNVRNVLGGTIHSDASFHMLYTAGDIVVKDNTVLFGDTAGCYTSVRGGVVYTKSQFSIQASSGYVKFLNNIVTKTGTSSGCEFLGAVAEVRNFTLNANSGRMIIFQNNGFDLGDAGGLVRGGVISMEWIAPIMFGGYSISVPTSLAITNNSSDIGFTGNFIKAGTGTSLGGALYGEGLELDGTIYNAPIKITGNKKIVSFAENYASGKNVSGGAIAACEHAPLIIQNNKYVGFSENVIQATADGGELKGGAIYFTQADASMKISGNGQVVFQGNAEISYDGTTRLRSVYADLTETNAAEFEWSAPDGGVIVVGDSITLINNAATNKQLAFNKAGGSLTGGTLLFTGLTTVEDLKKAKGGETPTDEEIAASRTSEIEGATVKMESGTLQIEDRARLQIHGKTEADSSEFNNMDVVLAAGDLVIQGSEKTYVDNTVLKLARSENGNGLTSHLIGTSASAAGPTLVVTNGLNIEIYNEASADHTDAFLVVEGFNLDLTGPVNLAIVDSELSDPDMRYDLFDFSQAGTGWEDLFGHLGETFTINGEEFSTEKYLHYDSATGKLFYQENLPKDQVPEPATPLLGIAALAALACRRRRKAFHREK